MDNNKIYGSSVLDQSEEIESFDDEKYTDEEINEARKELKENASNEKIQEVVSKDALTGAMASSINKYSKLDMIDNDLDNKNIRGKSLPAGTIEMVKTLTGIDITERAAEIAKYFETRDSADTAFANDDYDTIRDLIGTNVTEMVDNISKSSKDSEDIIRRLMSQIYAGYENDIKIIDDTKELSHIVRMVTQASDDYKESREKDEHGKEISPLSLDSIENISEQSIHNLVDAKEWIEKYLEKRKNIDDRNKRLKADYSVDDIDTKTVESVKAALDDAINMETITKFVSSNCSRMFKEFKNEKERNKVIKNWITDIKNATIYFTLPTNDYNTISKSVEDVKEFLLDALLAESFPEYQVPEDNVYDSVSGYYIKSGIASKKEIDNIRLKSEMILYSIAKTFKVNSLDEYKRRVLSYTLDMLSKLSRAEYREKFYEFSKLCYEYLG